MKSNHPSEHTDRRKVSRTFWGLALIATLWCVQGTLLFNWNLGDWFLRLAIPAIMWFVVVFMHVVRFLTYLDTRIRREGWEVELKVRAAAARWEGQFV